MAHPSVLAAVASRLADGFDRCPVFPENTVGSTPEDGSPFLVVQYPYSRLQWTTIAGPDGCDFTEEGAFRFVLGVERGAGADQGRQWLEELAALFRGQRFGGVQTYGVDGPAADDRNEDGNYYRLSIAVAYEFITTG